MSDFLMPEIETARLRLRLYRASDAATVHSIWLDPNVSQYFSPANQQRTEEQVLEILLRSHVRWRERGFSQWGITLKSDTAPSDKVIGYCGFQMLAQTEEVELYYGFPLQHWGQGFATEAARAALRYAFETVKLPRVVAVTHPGNTASHRVLEKIGMRLEGAKRFYEIDVLYFSISAADFRTDDSLYQLRLS